MNKYCFLSINTVEISVSENDVKRKIYFGYGVINRQKMAREAQMCKNLRNCHKMC